MVQANGRLVKLGEESERLYKDLESEVALIPEKTPQKAQWRETMRQVENLYSQARQKLEAQQQHAKACNLSKMKLANDDGPFDTSDEAVRKKGLRTIANLNEGIKDLDDIKKMGLSATQNMQDANLELRKQRDQVLDIADTNTKIGKDINQSQ